MIIALVLALAPALSPGGGELDRVLGEIVPRPEELAWQEIPWRPAFWGAVLEADAGAKPILLWAMNGHPLGCT